MTNTPAKIIILSGIPGSGKSTWSEWYVNHNYAAAIVSRDEIRETKFPQPYVYSKESESKVTELFNAQVDQLIAANWDIIIDNTNASHYWLLRTLKEMKSKTENKTYNVYVKFFDISLWRALWRVRRRFKKTGKVVPKKVVKDMYKSYKKIDKFKYENHIL